MKNIQYSISSEVFDKFPGYVRGVVLVKGVKNGDSSPELIQILREEEVSLRGRLKVDDITTEPRINAWREAFRSLGIKPSEYRCSIEAMSRRVLRGNELPAINMLVDIGNIISLRYLIPTGGHALDDVQGNIELRPAAGDEDFVPFGTQDLEHPDPHEFIFAEGNVVLTRRWSWRQANHTMTVPETRMIEFNVDGLPPVTREEVETVSSDLMTMVQKFCGGEISCQYITRENPTIVLNLD